MKISAIRRFCVFATALALLFSFSYLEKAAGGKIVVSVGGFEVFSAEYFSYKAALSCVFIIAAAFIFAGALFSIFGRGKYLNLRAFLYAQGAGAALSAWVLNFAFIRASLCGGMGAGGAALAALGFALLIAPLAAFAASKFGAKNGGLGKSE